MSPSKQRHMATYLSPLLIGAATATPLRAADSTTARLVHEIMSHGEAYENLAELVKIGPRMGGSPESAQALQWAKAKFTSYGFAHVSLLPMVAPVWYRGAVEKALVVRPSGEVAPASKAVGSSTARSSGEVSPASKAVGSSTARPSGDLPLAITALGGSIATPAGGVTAPVVRVKTLDEVQKLGAAVRGRIVFYDRPMDPAAADAFHAYGEAVDQRTRGASQAARYGAVAVIVRSIGSLPDDDHPHTGAVHYKPDAPKIPAAALSTHAANVLAAALAASPNVNVRLEVSGQNAAPAPSFNIMAELLGAAKPNEVVLLAAHLDSWDLGVGAQDDGAGVVEVVEALRAIKALGLKPKRTIRVVLFMSEETGGQGAEEYARQVARNGPKHVAAIESDGGAGAPAGFSVNASAQRVAEVRSLIQREPFLAALPVTKDYSGTDVEPLKEQGTLTMEFNPDGTHYFDVHHSALDQLSSVKRADLLKSAATISTLVWALANKP